MSTDIVATISQEEIEWVKSKHAGLCKVSRKILSEAFEIGQWFLEARERLGIKKTGRGNEWFLWLGAHFPRITSRTIARYMRLAEGRPFLEQQWDQAEKLGHVSEFPPTINQALRLLSDRDREQKEELEHPPAEFEEPLLILRNEMKSYVYDLFQLKYKEEQIRFRIKNEKLGRRQTRQAVEFVCQEHPELKELVLKTFLP